MYKDSIASIRQSIFPIFFQVAQGNLTRIGVSGTGFFIDGQGHFITANHVITDVPANSQLLYAGNVPTSINPPQQFDEVYVDNQRDIYVGRVNDNALPPVNLFHERTEIGSSICLCGYPMAQLRQGQNQSIDASNVRQYWQPTFAIDGANVEINGRNYDGFITQNTSLRGMSGGPVFDPDGNVHGIDVATLTRNIPQNNGGNMTIHNGIVVGFHSIQDILNQISNA